jgi:NAD-dependent SIR2 family protein deacetylase
MGCQVALPLAQFSSVHLHGRKLRSHCDECWAQINRRKYCRKDDETVGEMAMWDICRKTQEFYRLIGKRQRS